MHDFVGALDQGTSSTRFMVFDHEGNAVARHQLEHRQILPRPGWVEHDPLEILERAGTTMHAALSEAGLGPADLAAIGLTNQRETTVVWDRHTGLPYMNAIVWQDTRTDRIAAELDRTAGGQLVRQRTGLRPATYFSAGKIRVGPGELGYAPAGGTGRGGLLRDDRQLASLELHRGRQWGQARHRRDQRQPHDADGPAHAVLGR